MESGRAYRLPHHEPSSFLQAKFQSKSGRVKAPTKQEPYLDVRNDK
jgi:hypothetical protein